MEGLHLLFLCFTFLSILKICISADTLTVNQSFGVHETLVSAGENFELGFVSFGTSRYLGIWYKMDTRTVVWVANRDVPLDNNTSNFLRLTEHGTLLLQTYSGFTIWSSNSLKLASNPVAQLLDSGNLVVKENGNHNKGENFLWQSFDYPSDTLLPGMKVGIDRLTDFERYLTAWRTRDDPGRSSFTFRIDPHGFPQLKLRDGSQEKFRLGPWNGLGFSGVTYMNANPNFLFSFDFDEKKIYYGYQLKNKTVITRLVLISEGYLLRYIWSNRIHDWRVDSDAQIDSCDAYAMCGAFGTCVFGTKATCGCLKGFEPKNQTEWGAENWSSGCIRKVKLECGKKDGFLNYSNVKLPDTRNSYFNESMNLEECRTLCQKNCNCTAYANMNITNGRSGCFLWFGDLVDIKNYSGGGQDLYVKMAASKLGLNGEEKKRAIRISMGILVGVLLLGIGLTLYIWNKKHHQRPLLPSSNGSILSNIFKHESNERQKGDPDLLFFDLPSIVLATNNFAIQNKIGQGGFGPVYKGVLENGQEIAVKTLSKDSKQGGDEFKNEVVYIARLQHRNLVKLLGYCLQAEEKMLIYEYMPNKSLDLLIFDRRPKTLLDWPKRFNIIGGIARGLLYLHQDSRLRIIHRDLKASNILLDHQMNPKISDFGIARSFGGNDTEANTNKVVGTYGYMSPEYAIDGQFSIKSDVFSFGVVVLEIVSGKRNRQICEQGHRFNLTGLAWTLFEEGRSLELIDASALEESGNELEMQRAIHVGLLCVQECPEDRPEMSNVLLMLAADGALPLPKQPGFFTERKPVLETGLCSLVNKHESTNLLTITSLEGR